MEKGWLGDAADEPAFDFECNHHFCQLSEDDPVKAVVHTVSFLQRIRLSSSEGVG